MIKSLFSNNKITANQLAKQLMLDAIDAHTCEFDTEGMTDKERQDVYNAVTRQVERLNKLLNSNQLYNL